MPNWCHNTLLITGKEEDVCQWVEKAASFSTTDPMAEDQPLHLEAFYPAPADYNKDDFPLGWYTQNWGTKWDAWFSGEITSSHSFRRREGQVRYRFETAWAPPLQWLEKVAADYPSLDFSLTFGEPGMDFGGEARFSEGEVETLLEGTATEYLSKKDMWF